MFRLLKSKLLKSIVVPGITNVPGLATGGNCVGAGLETPTGACVGTKTGSAFRPSLKPTLPLGAIRKLLKNVVGGQ